MAQGLVPVVGALRKGSRTRDGDDPTESANPPVAAGRFSVITGRSLGLGMAVTRDMATAWAPPRSLGRVFAAGLVTTAVVRGLAA